jgi:hypothetical protein
MIKMDKVSSVLGPPLSYCLQGSQGHGEGTRPSVWHLEHISISPRLCLQPLIFHLMSVSSALASPTILHSSNTLCSFLHGKECPPLHSPSALWSPAPQYAALCVSHTWCTLNKYGLQKDCCIVKTNRGPLFAELSLQSPNLKSTNYVRSWDLPLYFLCLSFKQDSVCWFRSCLGECQVSIDSATSPKFMKDKVLVMKHGMKFHNL